MKPEDHGDRTNFQVSTALLGCQQGSKVRMEHHSWYPSRKLTSPTKREVGKNHHRLKSARLGWDIVRSQEGMLPICLSGEGCAANDRSGTCSGRLLKTGYLTIAQLLGHDVVLFCYRVAFCRFHLIFLCYFFFCEMKSHFFSGQVVSFILAGVLSTVLLVSVVLPNH